MKKIILLITIIGVILISAITVPSKEEYTNWFVEKASSQSESGIERGLTQLVGSPIIENLTTSKNYLLFNIYETSFNEYEKVTVIGIYDHFIVLSK